MRQTWGCSDTDYRKYVQLKRVDLKANAKRPACKPKSWSRPKEPHKYAQESNIQRELVLYFFLRVFHSTCKYFVYLVWSRSKGVNESINYELLLRSSTARSIWADRCIPLFQEMHPILYLVIFGPDVQYFAAMQDVWTLPHALRQQLNQLVSVYFHFSAIYLSCHVAVTFDLPLGLKGTQWPGQVDWCLFVFHVSAWLSNIFDITGAKCLKWFHVFNNDRHLCLNGTEKQ